MEEVTANPFTINGNQVKENIESFTDVYVIAFKESMRLTSDRDLSHEVALAILKDVKLK